VNNLNIEFLKIARKHTEPLPNSNWGERKDWKTVRKNIFKNLAFYHQKRAEWNKAFD
jgi:hypothetical protein